MKLRAYRSRYAAGEAACIDDAVVDSSQVSGLVMALSHSFYWRLDVMRLIRPSMGAFSVLLALGVAAGSAQAIIIDGYGIPVGPPNSDYSDLTPCVTGDGQTLVFCSDRPGGPGDPLHRQRRGQNRMRSGGGGRHARLESMRV